MFHLSQSVSFYLALPVVLPIAASGFLRIHGMTPLEYLKRRRGTVSMDTYHFVPELIMYPEKEEKPKSLADFETGHRTKKQRAEQQKLKDELKAVEQEIEYIENTISSLEEQLSQPIEDYRETIRLCDELENYRQQLGELYDRWLMLNGEE